MYVRNGKRLKYQINNVCLWPAKECALIFRAPCGAGGARKNLSAKFARNQLKRLISDERIQGNPSFFNPTLEGQIASNAAWPRKSKLAYRRPNSRSMSASLSST